MSSSRGVDRDEDEVLNMLRDEFVGERLFHLGVSTGFADQG
jgi:hypothetical protein